MKTSEAGLRFIQHHEGCVLKAYKDFGKGIWTIGWGHTGPEVKEGLVWTQAQADAALAADVATKAEAPIAKYCKVPLTQHQYDALVSFTFNVGGGALASSTLLRKLNAGDVAGAEAEFPKWDKVAGKPYAILTARRRDELAMFRGR